MMIHYLRTLTTRERSELGDRHLALFLTFVAGAANAGGFMAVSQYTSHMSGIVSALADNMVLGEIRLVLAGAGAFVAFVAGAALSAILINWARRLRLEAEYAFPLLLEAALLAIFGIAGSALQRHGWLFGGGTVMLLCFIMGLQNAIITKLSGARIRTTHVTGLVTDMGIEIGKLFYWNSPTADPTLPKVVADRPKLRLLASLIGLFLAGGVIGAVAFSRLGFVAALFLAAIVFILAVTPVIDDVLSIHRKRKQPPPTS